MWQSAGAAARGGEDGDQGLGIKHFISPWLNCKVRLGIPLGGEEMEAWDLHSPLCS